MIAMELNKKDNTVQVATLKTLMGQAYRKILKGLKTLMGQAYRKILKGLKLSDEKTKDPKEILQALQDTFVVTRNVLYDRYRFYTAKQQPQENVEQFLDRLRHLASDAKFQSTAQEDEALRDILVLGCRDEAARARLFR